MLSRVGSVSFLTRRALRPKLLYVALPLRIFALGSTGIIYIYIVSLVILYNDSCQSVCIYRYFLPLETCLGTRLQDLGHAGTLLCSPVTQGRSGAGASVSPPCNSIQSEVCGNEI